MSLLARLRDKYERVVVHPRLVREARQQTQVALKMSRLGKVLVLCHGNIYRSPFVARYLQLRLAGNNTVSIRSAGFHPRPDRPSPPPHVAMVRKRYGVDLADHRSTVTQSSQLREADLIVIMEPRQMVDILRLEPGARVKVVWLGAVAEDTPIVIADPYGRPEAEAEIILDQLARATEVLAQRLLNGALTSSANSPAATA